MHIYSQILFLKVRPPLHMKRPPDFSGKLGQFSLSVKEIHPKSITFFNVLGTSVEYVGYRWNVQECKTSSETD